ncbi:uberolysin/carnocyclin family circular bacteriocin [Agrococcus jejuensis]|uniref:Bacteriocin class IId cyclical uberolysin-like n=1 Tax=Agrococcus jejuensis TaxID=399736 RepID=A0A1G8BMA9_9MICO|nr:uberolysin/carnocyclin family circular bacteriocin [Agrococcus jejuensis]SDH34352.1 Bacteriocin class IId cyclical uberolysin-like [Agrococcus jejuensis]
MDTITKSRIATRRDTPDPRRASIALGTALAASAALLAVAGVSLAWLVGSFGISTAAASQIVTAIEIGGAAVAIITAILGAGVVGIVVSTVLWYLKRKLRALAIA